MKKWYHLRNCKSEIGNVCNVVGGHCLPVIKIVHHDANGGFDWLIQGDEVGEATPRFAHESFDAGHENLTSMTSTWSFCKN